MEKLSRCFGLMFSDLIAKIITFIRQNPALILGLSITTFDSGTAMILPKSKSLSAPWIISSNG